MSRYNIFTFGIFQLFNLQKNFIFFLQFFNRYLIRITLFLHGFTINYSFKTNRNPEHDFF